jgi:hypothetical protein
LGIVSLRITRKENDVFPIDIAEATKTISERVVEGFVNWKRPAIELSYFRNLSALFCASEAIADRQQQAGESNPTQGLDHSSAYPLTVTGTGSVKATPVGQREGLVETPALRSTPAVRHAFARSGKSQRSVVLADN